MRKLLLPLLLVAAWAFADTGLWQGATKLGPVRDLACSADGGFLCSRDAGYSQIGMLQCVNATATEPGCVTPSDQSWAGNKTLTGDLRIAGHAHASLTACVAGKKGTWQTCTDHSAPVFCNGTANVELLGVGSVEAFPAIYVNGLLHSGLGYLSAWTLPYAYTITNVSGFVGAGAGTTQNIRFTDGALLCDCSVDCATGGTNFSCTGNCTFPTSTLVVSSINSDGCTTPPTAKGILTPAGYR